MSAQTENSIIYRDEMQALTFLLNGVSYGVDVHQVREVKNFEGVTPIPYAPTYVKGVTNLRGEIIPVVDLRQRFGMASGKSSDITGILVILQDKRPIGVMVDSVMEVLSIAKKDMESSPQSLATAKSDAVQGVAKHGKDLIIIIDLLKAVTNETLEEDFAMKV